MVEYETWISIGMEQCAPKGEGSQQARRAVFTQLAQGWNDEKEQIKQMSESEVREQIECP